MAKTTDFYIRKMEEARAYFREGIQFAESDEDLVDMLGAGNRLEQSMKELRRTAAVELEGGMTGENFRFVQGKESVKTYNSHALLPAFAEATGMSVLETMLYLLQEGAVVLEWKFQKLEALAFKHDVTLTIASHDIEDGDPEHLIGKRWKDGSPTYKPL